MFGGDIICRSKPGYGSNFIFIAALDEHNYSGRDNGVSSERIQNPVK